MLKLCNHLSLSIETVCRCLRVHVCVCVCVCARARVNAAAMLLFHFIQKLCYQKWHDSPRSNFLEATY
jgi:hypothetical protein